MGNRTFRPTRDHMTPRSRGGTLEYGNKVIVCEPCNYAKGNLDIYEFCRVLTEDLDPRAFYVARFIRNMSAYFEGRLRIPQVLREIRVVYPNVRYFLQPPEPDEIDEPMAPAFGM